MRFIALQLLIGLLLIGVLNVETYGIDTMTVTCLQSGNQETTDLTQANELSNSAVKLYKAGKYKEALNPAKQALAIMERALPADDKRVVGSVGNLAAIHLALKNYKEAEVFYQRLLTADEKRSGPDSWEVAKTLDVLAWLHYARGNVSQSKADYKRVLAIKEKIAGTDSREVALTLFRLAAIHRSHGEPEAAVFFYQRLLKFDNDLALEPDVTVKDARNSFACLLRALNKPEEAEAVQPSQDDPPLQLAGDKASAGETGNQKKGVLTGRALELPKPAYPDEARDAGVSGRVDVRVTIDEAGKVIRACAEKGHPLLWQTAERAAYAAKFTPTVLSGQPVKVTGIITYNFVR